MFKRLASIFNPAPRLASAVRETDDSITIGSRAFQAAFRDRFDYDRPGQLTEITNLYRSSPLARRIVEISVEFMLGDGFSFSSPSRRVEKFLREFWNHPLNDLDEQLPEWAAEALRTGDLFLLCSVDAGGMTYVRAVPAEAVSAIETAANDYRQELSYQWGGMDGEAWPAYRPGAGQTVFMLHFPLNRLAGATFGESDLLPVKYWIRLYQDFLENRARLNHFRQIFSYVLQRNFNSQAEKESYVRSFAAGLPRKPGGLLALDRDETLGVVAPQLASSEAELDGLTLKRMIALGAGLPLHYLAEPESSNRSTAEAAGTPTFKRFKARQQYLRHAVLGVLRTALEVRAGYDRGLPAGAPLAVNVPDITERDNASLALAVQRLTQALVPLYNARKISARELVRLAYKFLGETPPVEAPEEQEPVAPGRAASAPAVDDGAEEPG